MYISKGHDWEIKIIRLEHEIESALAYDYLIFYRFKKRAAYNLQQVSNLQAP